MTFTNNARRGRQAVKRPEFLIQFEAPAFCDHSAHDTEEAAYTAARQARDSAEAGDPVTITSQIGGQKISRSDIGAIWILRWNSDAQDWLTHAHTWRRNTPRPEALTPLPGDFWEGLAAPRR